MHFNIDLLRRRRDEMNEKGVRIIFIGERDDPRVPDELRDRDRGGRGAHQGQRRPAPGVRLQLRRDGSRWPTAARRIAAEAAAGELDPADVDIEALSARLYLPEMPDPDLVIRSSGEQRTSNFLLWEAAYSRVRVLAGAVARLRPHTSAPTASPSTRSRDRRFGGADRRRAAPRSGG